MKTNGGEIPDSQGLARVGASVSLHLTSTHFTQSVEEKVEEKGSEKEQTEIENMTEECRTAGNSLLPDNGIQVFFIMRT